MRRSNKQFASVKKNKVIDTHPDFKDKTPEEIREMIARNTVLSARIEGIDITLEELAEARKRYGHLVEANIRKGPGEGR